MGSPEFFVALVLFSKFGAHQLLCTLFVLLLETLPYEGGVAFLPNSSVAVGAQCSSLWQRFVLAIVPVANVLYKAGSPPMFCRSARYACLRSDRFRVLGPSIIFDSLILALIPRLGAIGIGKFASRSGVDSSSRALVVPTTQLGRSIL